jgi:hypothetical protein
MEDTGPQNSPDDDLLDLLVRQVTEGLSTDEQRALDVLDGAEASALRRDLERAAAALTLAGAAGARPPPPALRVRLEQQAAAFFAQSGDRAATRIAAVQTPSAGITGIEQHRSRPRPPLGGTAGWWAAAACLVLAIFAWFRTPPPAVPPAARDAEHRDAGPHVVAEAPQPTPAALREALLAEPNAVKLSFGATKDPAAAGVSGDVVWDPVTQRGYLHFVGLRQNDPTTQQYQIWIFDGQRDQRYPVDGGVFDVPQNGSEVIVPIRAALPVHLAKAFAVTIEKAGGVVVSARDHVVALAQTT